MENKLKILVVEDEMIARTVVKLLLKELGYRVDTAKNGKCALMQVKRKQYDLILIDIGLPDINGIEVILKIRELEILHKVTVVALTGFLSQEVKKRCLAVGIVKVIQKPITSKILQMLVESL